MYADKFVFATFERNNLCVTADYGLKADGSISVFNAARLRTPDGKLTIINGTATIPDPSEPGKLSVSFDSVGTAGAPYWVLKLGPVTDGQYRYAIVSDNLRLGLFVLARNTEEFTTKYEDEVLAFLEENGFTRFINKPIETYQKSDCQYAPLSMLKTVSKQSLVKDPFWRNLEIFSKNLRL